MPVKLSRTQEGINVLPEYGCKEVILIQPEEHRRKKTDRRVANRLSELLWVNRQRLLAGQHVQGLRRVFIPSQEDQADRQLASLRKRLTDSRTRLINRIQRRDNRKQNPQERT
jgi:transposase